MKIHNLEISRIKWFNLMRGLKKRGNNERESGAFLLARINTIKIIKVLYYDELDPNSLDLGYINFTSKGFLKLWDYLFKYGYQVIADVHTHPGNWTNQSTTDIENPMIDSVNHIALIVPNYSKQVFTGLKGVGVFKFLGNNNWEKIK